jgi:hypothetical protein
MDLSISRHEKRLVTEAGTIELESDDHSAGFVEESPRRIDQPKLHGQEIRCAEIVPGIERDLQP